VTQADIGELARAYFVESNVASAQHFDHKELSKRLQQERWLSPHPKHPNLLILGIRASMELRTYLTDQFSDSLVECVICSDVVLAGERCTNELCSARMHTRCAEQWFRSHPPKCPTCTHAFRLDR
jgi:hypothetical protein